MQSNKKYKFHKYDESQKIFLCFLYNEKENARTE
jgi:hypothetical protein